jgi:hypothetical protein
MVFLYLKWILLITLLIYPTLSDANIVRILVTKSLKSKSTSIPFQAIEDSPLWLSKELYKSTPENLNKRPFYIKGNNLGEYLGDTGISASSLDNNEILRKIYREMFRAPPSSVYIANNIPIQRVKQPNFMVTSPDTGNYIVNWTSHMSRRHRRSLNEFCKKVDSKNKSLAHLKEYSELRNKMFKGNSTEEEITVLLEHATNKYLINGMLANSFEIELEKDLSGVKGFKVKLISKCGFKVDYTTDKNKFSLSGNWLKASISL